MDDNYCIRKDYIIRENNDFLDTSGRSDEYQKKVYLFALDVVNKYNIKNIADVGCGSGYKLMKYFNNYNIIGYDLEPTINILKNKYPNNEWIVSNFNNKPKEVDMVICADVIEHVNDPDELITFIKKMKPKHLIISTPDRDLLTVKLNRSNIGPPANKHHIREWTFNEFSNYIGQYFNVTSHLNIENEYGQLIYCKMEDN